MYRLNCHLTDDLGDRLANYCERAGMMKVSVVSLALDQYLKVALRKESVDRNNTTRVGVSGKLKSLSARRVWIEISPG